LEADLGGQAHEVVHRHRAELREAARTHFPDQPAGADPVDRIDHHALADFPIADVRAERGNLAGEIEAHDGGHRHLDARHAPTREDVVVVEGAGAHAYQRLSGRGHRVRVIGLVLDRSGTAVLKDDCRFHQNSLMAIFSKALRSTLFVPASGSSGTKKTRRGCWYAGALASTKRLIASSSGCAPARGTTKATGFVPLISSGTGTTHACATSGWRASTSSTSLGKMFSPPETNMSSVRPTNQ